MAEISTVLYDEQVPIDEKRALRLRFDLAETLNKATQYADELCRVRRIPVDTENISPRDVVLMYTTQKMMPDIKTKLASEADVIDRVTSYYNKAKVDVTRDSILIAMFAHADNLEILSEDPKPYPPPAPSDPLIFEMPAITKNLTQPIERRLKRLSDVLAETGALFKVESILEHLSVRINVFAQGLVEVDDQGFQSGRADGDVPAEVQPAGVQPKAQKKRSSG